MFIKNAFCIQVLCLGLFSPSTASSTPNTKSFNLLCQSVLNTRSLQPHSPLIAPQTVKRDNFQTSRTLAKSIFTTGYFYTFGKAFETKLTSLTSEQHWIDLGAGDGLAIRDYYRKYNGQASTQGIVYHENGDLRFTVKPQLPVNARFLSGRLFEYIDDSELEPADVITDLYGVISYTEDLSLTLKKIFANLKTNGSLFFFHGQNDQEFGTTIRIAHQLRSGPIPGSKLQTITNFLRLIPGLDIHTTTLHEGLYSTEVIKRPGFDINQIPSLDLIEYRDSHPPYRAFVTRPN